MCCSQWHAFGLLRKPKATVGWALPSAALLWAAGPAPPVLLLCWCRSQDPVSGQEPPADTPHQRSTTASEGISLSLVSWRYLSGSQGAWLLVQVGLEVAFSEPEPPACTPHLVPKGGWLLVQVGLQVAGPRQHAIIQVTLTRVPSSSHRGLSTLGTGLPNALAEHLIRVF